MPSSASSAFACTRECKLRVAPGSPSTPATSSSRRLSLVPFVLVAKTSAQLVPHSRANNFCSCPSCEPITLVRKTHTDDARLSQARSKTARELTSVLKGNCESGEQQARNSVRTPEG